MPVKGARMAVEREDGEREVNLRVFFAAFDLPWDEAPVHEGVPWKRRARPELHEVMALRRQRRATVAEVLDGLTDAELARPVSSATPFLADATGLTVADCLRVVLNEEWEHRLYAERDLAVLASR